MRRSLKSDTKCPPRLWFGQLLVKSFHCLLQESETILLIWFKIGEWESLTVVILLHIRSMSSFRHSFGGRTNRFELLRWEMENTRCWAQLIVKWRPKTFAFCYDHWKCRFSRIIIRKLNILEPIFLRMPIESWLNWTPDLWYNKIGRSHRDLGRDFGYDAPVNFQSTSNILTFTGETE